MSSYFPAQLEESNIQLGPMSFYFPAQIEENNIQLDVFDYTLDLSKGIFNDQLEENNIQLGPISVDVFDYDLSESESESSETESESSETESDWSSESKSSSTSTIDDDFFKDNALFLTNAIITTLNKMPNKHHDFFSKLYEDDAFAYRMTRMYNEILIRYEKLNNLIESGNIRPNAMNSLQILNFEI
eukprot:Pgem_evm1s16872